MSTDGRMDAEKLERGLEFENACLALAHAVSAHDRAHEALAAAALDVRRIERAINDQRTAPAPLDVVEADHIQGYLHDLEAELATAREFGRIEQIRLYESERIVEEYREELEARSAALASIDPRHAAWRNDRNQPKSATIRQFPGARRR